MSHISHLSQLHYALGQPESTARIRQQPEDFQVREQLTFNLDGNGQHVYLYLEKRNLNTDDLAKQLAKFAGTKPLAIGYAGLKDRHAVTTQWFSVDLAGKPEPDWSLLSSEDIKVRETVRHGRKLKRGAVRYNYFQLTLKEFNGDERDLTQRLEYIQSHGAPNYFGEQRFGRNDANLKQAEKLFLEKNESSLKKKRINRHLRGIYLSAVRSFLFNQVLSQRVLDKTWNHPVAGDVFMLEGSHSVFTSEVIDAQIIRRVNEFDIHPTGPMWGSGDLMTSLDALATEMQIAQLHREWCEALVDTGLKQERRALRVHVEDLDWHWQGGDVVLNFKLPAGSYATSVLRELVVYN
ncbi:tRNA pseudouridine(13) synthase TruD [Kaarinaea lacus]